MSAAVAQHISPRHTAQGTISYPTRFEKKKRILHVGSYEVGKTLGHGTFGKVKLGTNVFTQEKVAIKFLKHSKLAGRHRESSDKEIAIMKFLAHENIVKLIDVINKPDEGYTFIVVEFISGGELFDYIVAQEYVKEKEARKFFRQIVSAVEYCHGNLIVHRDLKPENLLLDDKGNIKISDFGLSNVIEPGQLMDSFCGSPLYAAPEILMAEKYVGPPVDIWSMGVILYALLVGSLPWEGESQAEISYNSVHAIYSEPENLSPSVRDLIRKMLTPNPKERATIEDVRSHPWTNETFDAKPSSFLPEREPVMEIRDDVFDELMTLGFKKQEEEDIRTRILDNQVCQATAMYHLLLDKFVEEEMAAVRTQMAALAAAATAAAQAERTPDASPPRDVPEKGVVPASPATHRRTQRGRAGTTSNMSSPRGNTATTPRKMAAIEEEEEGESSEGERKPQSDSNVNYRAYEGGSTDESPAAPHPMSLSTPAVVSRRSPVVPFSFGEPSSVPDLAPPIITRRRASVAGPAPVAAPPSPSPSVAPFSTPLSSSLPPQPMPKAARRFSLDARVAAANTNAPRSRFDKDLGSVAPRVLKGIYKSTTTSSKAPQACAKIVKKALEDGDFFSKKSGPFLFLVYDEQSGVRFDAEVCLIPALNLTGLHLKRKSGDVWAYKKVATELLNYMHL